MNHIGTTMALAADPAATARARGDVFAAAFGASIATCIADFVRPGARPFADYLAVGTTMALAADAAATVRARKVAIDLDATIDWRTNAEVVAVGERMGMASDLFATDRANDVLADRERARNIELTRAKVRAFGWLMGNAADRALARAAKAARR